MTVLVLPLSLGFGTTLIWLLPGLWSVLFTNACDQGLRFSIDKASYELLYLPIPPTQRVPVKNAIDIVGNRVADGCGALLLGLATQGFFGWFPGLGLGLLHHRRNTPRLRSVLPPLARRLSLVAMACFVVFAAISTYIMLVTPFRLDG